MAYATGGLWYTSNNGQSLVPVFDKENVFGIGDIAVDWRSRTIWVGTGGQTAAVLLMQAWGCIKAPTMEKHGNTWACPKVIISVRSTCIRQIKILPG